VGWSACIPPLRSTSEHHQQALTVFFIVMYTIFPVTAALPSRPAECPYLTLLPGADCLILSEAVLGKHHASTKVID